ncbi:MAG: helix-turn-helix domain-containing protein [Anaerolineales bacterium]|jgi:transcriptional regulator with XRE-family HTH domain|nr:helix-turn-helix domain-containing protein [Anaerolineales bacterium]
MDNPLSIENRAQRLGELIREARMAAGKSALDCAQAAGATEESFLKYETGEASPSLPEIELLSYFLQIPIEYFWGVEALKPTSAGRAQVNPQVLLGLRGRMVGVLLRKARLDNELSQEALSAQTSIPVEQIQAYELGQKPIPMVALDVLAAALGYSLRHFQDQRGPIGAWMAEQRSLQDFNKLPPELQAFVSKPVNRPYLEMAQRLSEMPVDKLRAIAEGLLEITL